MAYCTASDLIAEFGEQTLIDLTDRADPPAGVIDTVTLDRAIAAADAEIDGYLAVRYLVPIAPAPVRLVGVACDIVRYRLQPDRVTDDSPVLRRYKDAVVWLKDVSAGKSVLPGASGPATEPPSGGLAEVVQSGRKVFGGGFS